MKGWAVKLLQTWPGPTLAAILVGVLCSFSTDAVASKPRIPEKAALKAKVAELYEATEARDSRRLRALVLPQLFTCERMSSDAFDDDEEPDIAVLKWKITEIRFDMHGFNEIDEMCPGQRVRPTAGALVLVEQTDQEPGQAPETGLTVLPWIYVDKTWWWLIDVD